MRSLSIRIVLACLVSSLVAAPVSAAEENPAGEIGLLFGISRLDRDVVGPRRDPDYSPVFGLRLGANLHRPVSQFLEGLYGRFEADASEDKSEIFTARAGLERNFAMGTKGCTWYLAGAVGWADANLPTGGDFGRPLVSAGIGARTGGSGWNRWHVELREEWWLGDEGIDGKDVANTQFLVGWSVGLADEREPMFERGSRTLILEGVTFITDSAELTAESRSRLDRTAASLRAWREVRVEVGGHTDAVADDAYNLELSQRRAESVRAYLIHAGVRSQRLVARGYGETRPIATNETESGRARNRRVELTRID